MYLCSMCVCMYVFIACVHLCMTTRTLQTWLYSDRLLVSTVPQHQDASELSVSIELSAPESYEGGLCKFTRELLLLVTYGYMPIDCLL